MNYAGWLLVAGLSFVALLGVLTSLGPFYHSREEREALRAFLSWRESPSPETEERWKAARDEASRKEMTFRTIAFVIGGTAALAASVGARRLRRSARANATIP